MDPQALLREKYGIDENGIFKGAKEMLEEERSGSVSTSHSKTSLNRAFPNPE